MEVDEQLLEIVWDMTPAYSRGGCAMRPEQVLHVIDVDELEFDRGELLSSLRHEGQIRSCARDIPIGERFSRCVCELLHARCRHRLVMAFHPCSNFREGGPYLGKESIDRCEVHDSPWPVVPSYGRQGLLALPCERPRRVESGH